MDPTGQLRGGADPWTPPVSYAAACKAVIYVIRVDRLNIDVGLMCFAATE